VETDGPVPGLYSMLAIGLAAFTMENQVVWEREIHLHPLPDASQDRRTMEWWNEPEQADAWHHLQHNRRDPKMAMIELASELEQLKKLYRVFVVAWPACFDWMFLHWYFHKFVGDNPLGRRAKCADSYAWAMSRTRHPNITLTPMLESWDDGRFKHTHKALGKKGSITVGAL
jgi:hypothetical protein